MALAKKIETSSGHEVAYHRIGYIEHSIVDRYVRIGVVAYRDAKARTAGTPWPQPRYFTIAGDDYDIGDGETPDLGWCYGKLKALPEFEKAKDC